MAFGFLKKLAKVGLPILGTALGGPLGGAIGGGLGGLVSGGGLGGTLAGAAGGGLGGLALGNVGGLGAKLAKLGLSPSKLAELGLAGAGLAQGASQQGKANQINQQLLQQIQGETKARQPLQQAAIAKLLAPPPGAPDLSSIFQSSSPFARSAAPPTTGLTAPVPGAPVPGAPSPGPTGPGPTVPGGTNMLQQLARLRGGIPTAPRMRPQ